MTTVATQTVHSPKCGDENTTAMPGRPQVCTTVLLVSEMMTNVRYCV